jgi:hypothetical protein
MGHFIELPEVLVVASFAFCFGVIVIPFWQIFKKAGFSPWLSILMSIPLLNGVVLYLLAFARWPNAGPPKPTTTSMS